MSSECYETTVIIPTKNRKDDLKIALNSLIKQNVELEIIVLDDGSTDGTDDMIKIEYPTIKLIRSDQSLGSAVQRNIGTKLASNPIIISIDDDVELQDEFTIEQILNHFDHPRVGVVTIPFININIGPKVFQEAPNNKGISITNTFIGLGYAYRKDIYLRLNGFRDIIYMEGEESDLSLGMLEKGYVVRLGSTKPIHHFYSPKRENDLRFLLKCRNHVIIAWFNDPIFYLIIHLIRDSFNCLILGLSSGRFLLALRGLLKGFGLIFSEWSSRNPVSLSTYKLFRELRKRGAINLCDIEKRLSPLYKFD